MKTALITGGAGGIGSAICTGLAGAGFQVAVHYHTKKETAEALEQEVQQVCEHYTQVFRKALLERFQGHVAFYDDALTDSTDSWISLQETRDSRVVSMANNMFLVANVIHDSSDPSLK